MIVCPIPCVYPLDYLRVVSCLRCSSSCIQMIAGVVLRTFFFLVKFSDDIAIVSLLLGDQDDGG